MASAGNSQLATDLIFPSPCCLEPVANLASAECSRASTEIARGDEASLIAAGGSRRNRYGRGSNYGTVGISEDELAATPPLVSRTEGYDLEAQLEESDAGDPLADFVEDFIMPLVWLFALTFVCVLVYLHEQDRASPKLLIGEESKR